MGLIRDSGAGPVALDTSTFISFIEEHPEFLPVVEPLFEAIDAGRVAAVTSSLTLLEVLVIPYRTGDADLAARYERLLTRSRGLTVIDIERPLLRAAAHLRARTRMRTPDAIQVAAALSMRCTAFVTNDRDLPAIPGLSVLQLGAYR